MANLAKRGHHLSTITIYFFGTKLHDGVMNQYYDSIVFFFVFTPFDPVLFSLSGYKLFR